MRPIDIAPAITDRYLVVTGRPVDHPDQTTRDLPMDHSAPELIASPSLRISRIDAASSPWRAELGRIRVFDDDERDLLMAGTEHVVIENEAPPADQPRRAQQVRSIARAVARAGGGLLVDLCTSRPVPQEDRRVDGEREWFCLADDWLGFDCLINPDGGIDDRPTECSCLCLFTQGLHRFGLPELVIDEVACAYDLAATNVMRGLAVHMLGRVWAHVRTYGDATRLPLAESVVVEPEWMWGYWGARPLFGRQVPVRVVDARRQGLPTDRRYLEIVPHPDFNGTRSEWGGQILDEGLSSVAGWQSDDPPYRIDGAASAPAASAPAEHDTP